MNEMCILSCAHITIQVRIHALNDDLIGVISFVKVNKTIYIGFIHYYLKFKLETLGCN